MASASGKGAFQPDSDVHITYEDQQKINKFAKLNAKMEDLKQEMALKENKMQDITEAASELELADEDDKIPYYVGEIFIYQNLEAIQNSLEEAKSEIKKEIDELKGKHKEVEDLMTDLKTHLYGKFGGHINLEIEDD